MRLDSYQPKGWTMHGWIAGGLLVAVGRAQSQIQCSSRIKATNRSSANLFSLVSLGIFAHGASHFSPICTTIFDGITPGQVSRRYMRMPRSYKGYTSTADI